MKLNEKLKTALRKTDMSQSELSKLTGISPASISCYINGVHVPSAENLSHIAEALNVSVDYFINEDEDYIAEEALKSPESILKVSVDPVTREKASDLFEKLGLNMNVAVNLFLKQCIHDQGIPFQVNYRPKSDDNQ